MKTLEKSNSKIQKKSLKDFTVGEKLIFAYYSFWRGSIFQKLDEHKEGTPFKEMKNKFRLKEFISDSFYPKGTVITVEEHKGYRTFRSGVWPSY